MGAARRCARTMKSGKSLTAAAACGAYAGETQFLTSRGWRRRNPQPARGHACSRGRADAIAVLTDGCERVAYECQWATTRRHGRYVVARHVPHAPFLTPNVQRDCSASCSVTAATPGALDGNRPGHLGEPSSATARRNCPPCATSRTTRRCCWRYARRPMAVQHRGTSSTEP
jgi:hypothetical protein